MELLRPHQPGRFSWWWNHTVRQTPGPTRRTSRRRTPCALRLCRRDLFTARRTLADHLGVSVCQNCIFG